LVPKKKHKKVVAQKVLKIVSKRVNSKHPKRKKKPKKNTKQNNKEKRNNNNPPKIDWKTKKNKKVKKDDVKGNFSVSSIDLENINVKKFSNNVPSTENNKKSGILASPSDFKSVILKQFAKNIPKNILTDLIQEFEYKKSKKELDKVFRFFLTKFSNFLDDEGIDFKKSEAVFCVLLDNVLTIKPPNIVRQNVLLLIYKMLEDNTYPRKEKRSKLLAIYEEAYFKSIT